MDRNSRIAAHMLQLNPSARLAIPGSSWISASTALEPGRALRSGLRERTPAAIGPRAGIRQALAEEEHAAGTIEGHTSPRTARLLPGGSAGEAPEHGRRSSGTRRAIAPRRDPASP